MSARDGDAAAHETPPVELVLPDFDVDFICFGAVMDGRPPATVTVHRRRDGRVTSEELSWEEWAGQMGEASRSEMDVRIVPDAYDFEPPDGGGP